MTTIESLQKSIHYNRRMLIKSRSVKVNNDLDILVKKSNIEFYINEIKELKLSLSNAIKQNELKNYNDFSI